MLGLRNNVLDSGASPAEFVFGTTLKVPGELILPEDFSPNRQIFLEEFRELMRKIQPIPVEHRHKRKIFVYKDLYSCSHIFIRQTMIKKSLEPLYSGPHKVLNRTSDRVFEVEVNGLKKQISLENLKPAYFVSDDALIVNNETNSKLSKISCNSSIPNTIINKSTEKQGQICPAIRTYVNKKKKVSFESSSKN